MQTKSKTYLETSIFKYDRKGLETLLKSFGAKPFHVKQLIEWLYKRGVTSYSEMTNLSKNLQESLNKHAPLVVPQIIDVQHSKDGTRKYVLQFRDGLCVETVGIPSRDTTKDGTPKRLTVCFSTQIGCPMGCAFCATGFEGFSRNLLPGEIVEQILTVQKDFGTRVTNVVAMGQGEPFLNFDNVLGALRFINSSEGLGIGARHISISSCGVLDGIRRLSEVPEQFTLAISLHSAIQSRRDTLMPKCASMPLKDLKQELMRYIDETNRRVTFEYIMIANENTSPHDLKALIAFCKGLLCHVNLLPINEIDESPFKPVPTSTLKKWVSSLEQQGIETTIRDSRGSDIDGACGQLKNSLHIK